MMIVKIMNRHLNEKNQVQGSDTAGTQNLPKNLKPNFSKITQTQP